MSHLVREFMLQGVTMRDGAEEELRKPLGANRVKSRSQSGRSFSYIEGYDVIDTANRIFGFDGWAMEVKSVHPTEAALNRAVYQAVVGVHVGSAYREDIGHGIAAGDSPEAHETAMKGAVTDAMKRAFRTFGAQFGNSLYDKDGPELAPEERECPIHQTAMSFVAKNKTWAHRIEVDGKAAVCTGEAA